TPVGVDGDFPLQFAQDAVFKGYGKADGDEGEIGADDELGARDRLTFLVHFAAANTGQLTLLANELQSCYLELALGPLRLARRGSHLGRPVGPDRKLVFLFRGLRPYVELGDSHRALPEGGPDAIRGGVAAADDDNMLSACHDRLGRPGNRLDILAANAPVLLHQIGHGVMHAVEIAPGYPCRPWLLRPSAIKHRVIIGEKLAYGHVDADIDAAEEAHALALHLLDAAVDKVLLQLEIGNPVAQQAARPAFTLIDMDFMTGAAQLLGGSHAGRTGPDDRDALAGLLLRRIGSDIAGLISLVGQGLLHRLDGDGNILKVQRAGFLAGRRADPSGEFREIVGRMQVADRLFPVPAIDEV